MQLSRPLAVFDLETTGVNPAEDRVVELAVVLLKPDGARETRSWLVNPGCRIPPGATAVHGITDEDVAGVPDFAARAQELFAALEGCDLAGFNAERFDVPLLAAEFRRVGMAFPVEGTRIIDARTIFVRKEPRDLAAAVDHYCGRSHAGAHRAEADAVATADVLLAQLERYDDLPRDVAGLDTWLHPRDPSWLDNSGKLAWHMGEPVLTFGKHKERSLQELAKDEPGYLKWILTKDFPADTQSIIAEALDGRFPQQG